MQIHVAPVESGSSAWETVTMRWNSRWNFKRDFLARLAENVGHVGMHGSYQLGVSRPQVHRRRRRRQSPVMPRAAP